MTTRDNAVATAFDEIAAAFGDHARCEETTQHGARCQRPARWRIDLHGCEQVNMCGQHKAAWLKRGRIRDSLGGWPRCDMCGRIFVCVDEAVRVVAI